MIRAFDMFCGAGGSSAGARAAGAEIVAGVDICAIASETFAANFPGARVITERLENSDWPRWGFNAHGKCGPDMVCLMVV